jgi:homopolymeric O-antigen transport system permease protein
MNSVLIIGHATSLFRSKDLLVEWTRRNVRARYQQSALGWLWAVIQPVSQVAIFTIIFTRFVPVDTGKTPYALFSYAATVPWAFLAASLTDMSSSIVGNMGLVTKIYFPREVLPIAAMLARLMDFGLAVALLIVLIIYFQAPIFPMGWLLVPAILIIQLGLILGLGLALAAANVFYRDVQSLLTLIVQLWFYASPIIYPVTTVPERLRVFYLLNPMAGIIEAYRDVLLNGKFPGTYLLESAFISVVVLILGYWFFKRAEFQFADIV